MKLIVIIVSLVVLSGCQSVASGDFGVFKRSLNDKTYGYQHVPDPIDPSNNELVERFEVRGGDCGYQPGWNDCQQDRERSELSQRTNRQEEGQTYWYGWEMYFPQDYPSVYPTKTALGQFHQQKGKPVFMFQNQTHSVKGHNTAQSGGYHLDWHAQGRTQRFWPLISEDQLRGKWHRIEVHAYWSKKQDGFFKVWVNGELKADYQGPTMEKDKVYFKYGVYRSYISRYKQAHNADMLPTQVVYYRYVVRGVSRESVQP